MNTSGAVFERPHHPWPLGLPFLDFWCFFGLGFTMLLAATRWPYHVFTESIRANLWLGAWCALCYVGIFIFQPQGYKRVRAPEMLIFAVLQVLTLLTACYAQVDVGSLLRSLIFIASAGGGFWVARLLLTTPYKQEIFKWFGFIALMLLVGKALLGYFLHGTVFHDLEGLHHNPLANTIMLLFYGPIAMVLSRRRWQIILGILALCLGYLVFYLSGSRAGLLMPVALSLLVLGLGLVRLRYLFIISIPLAAIIVTFFYNFPSKRPRLENYEASYYRIENYPFSWHIAVQHPWLGIGDRSPRDKYLKGYKLKYPYVERRYFVKTLKRVVTSESVVLTFMVDKGFPFLIIYLSGVIYLFWRLLKIVRGKIGAGGLYLPPLALFFPISACMLHCLVYDGLLYPQVSFFFHLLLGLIPVPWYEPKSL